MSATKHLGARARASKELFIRKIDKQGRVVLPIELRRQVTGEDQLDLRIENDEIIVGDLHAGDNTPVRVRNNSRFVLPRKFRDHLDLSADNLPSKITFIKDGNQFFRIITQRTLISQIQDEFAARGITESLSDAYIAEARRDKFESNM